ncbi:hypothetical protein PTKIN_Ptkin07bG0106600 [Pterospermum kingtungense]
MDVRNRRGRGREGSPDRVKPCIRMQPKVAKPIRKVKVVYYLTRNGYLEHPHYMEVTHMVNQPLRLRDVMERLTALRGKGMPSLYSWSCKRSYKNGYVWNDLADSDIIPPSDGAEYVLKGSELVEGCSERLQQLQISNRVPNFQEPSLHGKQKSPTFTLTRQKGSQERAAYEEQEFDEEEEEEEEYEVDEEKTSYTSSTTSNSRCSRGVSTDELEDQETNNQEPSKTISQTAHEDSSRLPTASILTEKQNKSKNTTSKRFEDGDPVTTESAPSRNSVLLQFIACGNLGVTKAKNVPTMKQPVPNNLVKKSENLRRGVLCKSAVKVAEDDDHMKSCMYENPRFCNLQAEDKEYFSGSIVESMNSENRVAADQAVLKKSNSYNEERSCKAGLGETVEEEKNDKAAVKGKCIPRKKSAKPNQKMRG